MQLSRIAIGLGLAATCAAASGAWEPVTRERAFAEKPFRSAVVATFDSPWAMAFLPDGSMLVTEKAGKMTLLSADGARRTPVGGMPRVNASGQGGLGEVVPDPHFSTNRRVYFSYATPGAPNGVVLACGKLAETAAAVRLEEVRTLYRARPLTSGGHYAGRIAFSPDGHLFFSMGERQQFTPAQDRQGLLGKIVRLTSDGKPAPSNPLSAKGFDPAVWSYGHRNPLGLAFDGQGRLWEAEMGPQGGDEVNLILPGRNYGWPLVSNGDHYGGRPIPDHSSRPDLEGPKVSWNPSISPSSLMIYSGRLFPQWRGKALLGALSGMLVLVDLGAERAHETARYDMGERIRAVRQGPDGAVYLLEDGAGGKLLKLTPAG